MPEKPTGNSYGWVADHPRIAGMFLLALAALNGWISFTIYAQHPYMAVLNAVMAAVLVGGVVMTRRSPEGEIRPMPVQHFCLSEAALRALSVSLLDEDFDQDAPEDVLDDVLAYLGKLSELSGDEAALKLELEAMPDLARRSLSRAIAAARRKS